MTLTSRHIRILSLVVIFNLLFDQLTKWIARTTLEYGVVTSYFYDILRVVYVENSGVAFSLGSEWPAEIRFLVFNIVVLIFLIGLGVYVWRDLENQSFGKVLAFTFIISGGAGNVIDRFFRDGAVVDFLNVGFGYVRTAIFNYADMCITSGIILLLILAFLESRKPAEPVSEPAE
ncbi:MAG: signal peptidase II [Bacteroidetes bacterium]|nr:signal peptidase II [Bacteroidota bacterium]